MVKIYFVPVWYCDLTWLAWFVCTVTWDLMVGTWDLLETWTCPHLYYYGTMGRQYLFCPVQHLFGRRSEMRQSYFSQHDKEEVCLHEALISVFTTLPETRKLVFYQAHMHITLLLSSSKHVLVQYLKNKIYLLLHHCTLIHASILHETKQNINERINLETKSGFQGWL